jgi:hypothetical protein
MEVTKQGYQKNILDVLREAREMLNVLHEPGEEDNPDNANDSSNLLRLRAQASSQLPKKVQHGKIVNKGPASKRRLEDGKGAPWMTPRETKPNS